MGKNDTRTHAAEITRRQLAATNGNGKPHEEEPARPKPDLNGLNVFYDRQKEKYFRKDASGEYISVSMSPLKLFLRSRGVPQEDYNKDPNGLSTMEKHILDIQDTRNVDFAGPLAGYLPGYYELGSLKVLVTTSPRLIKPTKGKWPTLKKFLGELFGDSQFDYFMGWMQWAQRSMLGGPPFKPGQILIVSGPPGCGKSLLQSLITKCLGNRESKPYSYMVGKSNFNGEMAGSEHLVISDDPAHTHIAARLHFGHQLKAIAVNPSQYVNAKGRQGTTLYPFWRVSITLNERPEDLLILPPLDEDMREKVLLLRAFRVNFPYEAGNLDQWKLYTATLAEELAAFLWDVLRWPVQPDLRDQRYGVKSFLNQDLRWEVDSLAPELKLLQLIDTRGLLDVAAGCWEGSADQLHAYLVKNDPGQEAIRIFNFNNACGTYLARLAEKCPQRVTRSRGENNRKRWRIVHEKEEALE